MRRPDQQNIDLDLLVVTKNHLGTAITAAGVYCNTNEGDIWGDSKAENLINHYFEKREKKKVRHMNWGDFLLDNFIFSLFNFGWYVGAYQALFIVFAALFFVSMIAIALSVLFLIFISVMLINLYKLINFSRRKLLVELIEMANNES